MPAQRPPVDVEIGDALRVGLEAFVSPDGEITFCHIYAVDEDGSTLLTMNLKTTVGLLSYHELADAAAYWVLLLEGNLTTPR